MAPRGAAAKEEEARVTKRQRRGLHSPLGAADVRAVRRGVVLHLLTGRELVLAGGARRRVADAVSATERGQRRVRQRHAVLRHQLLVDAHQVALAADEQRQDLVAQGLGLLGSRDRWRRRPAIGEHRLDRAARDAERTGDRARPLAGVMERQDGGSDRLVQHASPR
jgi:hypothetical protein